MAQHFLLSSAARSLSLATVARMSDEEAWDAFRLIRWSDTQGEPVCPRCGCLDAYTYKTRKVFRCKGCSHQFTVTSGTIFASRKLPIRDYLLAIAIFVNGAKGHSALQLSRDLDCQYKIGLRAGAQTPRSRRRRRRTSNRRHGEVEIDGGYFGGYVKPGKPEREPPRPSLWREPIRQAPRRRRHARAQRQNASLRCARQRMWRSRLSASASRMAARSMPTKRRIGISCTRAI